MNRRDFVRLSVAGAAGFALGRGAAGGRAAPRAAPPRASAYDLIVRGGTLVDGLGGAPRRGEIAFTGDRIAALGAPGALGDAPSGRVVDATGKIVCPGFVDLHSHSDWTLLDCPTADSRIRQGITTEVTGNCGSSAAPAEVDGAERGVAAWFDELEARRAAVNVALLVGQGTLRQRALGASDRCAGDAELARMVGELEAAMDAGAIGLSTGLEYVPGTFTPPGEIEALARVVARRGGLYASHLRNEVDAVLAAVDEAVAIARATGVRTQISHFKVCGRSFWPHQDEALAQLERARMSGLDVAADAYPYTAYSTGLSIVLPAWAREGGSEAMLARLADPARRAEIAAAVRAYVATEPGDFDLIVISSVGEGGRPDAVGRSLAAIAAGDGVEPVESLLRLLEQSRDEISYVGFAMSEENVAKVLAHPLVCFGSDGYALRAENADGDRPHPRSYGGAVRLLARYCRELGTIDLPTAVRKLTAFPADRAGLADRGRLVPGCFADVVVLDLEKLADTATYEEPKRYPTGIEQVWVNGTLAIEDGAPTGVRAGRVLRRT